MADDQKCMKVIKVLNILTALVIIGFGIAGIIVMAIENLLAFRFFLVFSPIFMTLFGIVMLAAECKVKAIFQHLGFLQSLIGRGIFSIYMASTVFYYFSCGSGSDVAGWILGSILFVLGIVYFILHCCGGESYKQEIKEQMM